MNTTLQKVTGQITALRTNDTSLRGWAKEQLRENLWKINNHTEELANLLTTLNTVNGTIISAEQMEQHINETKELLQTTIETKIENAKSSLRVIASEDAKARIDTLNASTIHLLEQRLDDLASETDNRLSHKAGVLSQLNISVLNNSAWAQRIENSLINAWDHSNSSDADLTTAMDNYVLKTDFANSFDQHIDDVVSSIDQLVVNHQHIADKLDSVADDVTASLPALFHIYDGMVCKPAGLLPITLSTARKCAMHAAEQSARYFSYNSDTEQCYVPTNTADKTACPAPTTTCVVSETQEMVTIGEAECDDLCGVEYTTEKLKCQMANCLISQTVSEITPEYTYYLQDEPGSKLYSVDEVPLEPIIVDTC